MLNFRAGKFIGAALLVSLALSSVALGQVYRKEGANGSVTYSSKPLKGGKKAELPEIMRGDVKLTTSTLKSCDKHGGINCTLGADSDGSVICFDGFREASARFRFSCSASKIEVTEVGQPDDVGHFIAYLRNSKSVKAEKVSVYFKQADGKEVKLLGPTELEPFGAGEYHYNPPAKGNEPQKPGIEDLRVDCRNC